MKMAINLLSRRHILRLVLSVFYIEFHLFWSIFLYTKYAIYYNIQKTLQVVTVSAI